MMLKAAIRLTKARSVALAIAVAIALPTLSVPETKAQSTSSITVNGSSITVIGGRNQSVRSVNNVARIDLDGVAISIEPGLITVDGERIPIERFSRAVIDATGWGLTITIDDRVVFTIDDIEGLQGAAEEGDAAAQNNLANRLSTGQHSTGGGPEEDARRAAELYRLAAEQGLVVAQSNYAYRLWNGNGVAEDRAEAVSWFRQAADAGNIIAMVGLAQALFEGEGTAQNPEQALAWFERAAEAGNTDAMNYIGHILATGAGVDRDPEQAVSWFRRAAGGDHAMGTRNLAIHLMHGDGVEQDHDEARRLLNAAVALGYEPAREDLAMLEADPAPEEVSADDPPVEHETAEYWYALQRESLGPVSLGELRGMMDEGRISETTLVWRQGTPDWVAAGTIDALQ
ncbi:GYF domain-containing protein [Fodinicurvata sp. EGI_FJ10296]|uniref:GYF domain-containing protein n=1 Tax=Fodinicurvata sp. EGI_FJ10296 TaxID=3231908 RepID=UPI0034518279